MIVRRISNAWMAYAGLKHMWYRSDISVKVEGPVYCTAVRSVLLYGCVTWSVCISISIISHKSGRSHVASESWGRTMKKNEKEKRKKRYPQFTTHSVSCHRLSAGIHDSFVYWVLAGCLNQSKGSIWWHFACHLSGRTECSTVAFQLEASVSSAWHPVINQISSLRSIKK